MTAALFVVNGAGHFADARYGPVGFDWDRALFDAAGAFLFGYLPASILADWIGWNKPWSRIAELLGSPVGGQVSLVSRHPQESNPLSRHFARECKRSHGLPEASEAAAVLAARALGGG